MQTLLRLHVVSYIWESLQEFISEIAGNFFLLVESATIEMAFPDVCLEVRESEKKITLEARVRNR